METIAAELHQQRGLIAKLNFEGLLIERYGHDTPLVLILTYTARLCETLLLSTIPPNIYQLSMLVIVRCFPPIKPLKPFLV